MFFKREDGVKSITELPEPYIWSPTGKWDGYDGKWSTFMINVGITADDDTAGHNFRVLPYVSTSVTLLPRRTDWCDVECAKKRGVEPFKSQQPLGFEGDKATWSEQGQFAITMPYGWQGSQFNDTIGPNGVYGLGTVGLGPSSENSWWVSDVWAIETPARDLFMGSLGLGVDPVHIGEAQPEPFLMKLIGGREGLGKAYSYSAGASYRNFERGATGSVIFGGYDRTRFIGQTAEISMPQGNNTLLVGVQSIIYRPQPGVQDRSPSFTAETSTFFAAIDSTLPYLYLPEEICDQFEKEFQLTYDESTKFYMINSTSHRWNNAQNATVSFKIGESKDNTDGAAIIELPYAAFALTGSEELFPNSSMYFPLKRSINGQNVLGRAFLQEAYLIVDYERRNFTVAAAAYSESSSPTDVVPILSKDFKLTPQKTDPSDDSDGGLPPGAIAGIVVGIVAVLGLLALAGFLWWRKRRGRQNKLENAEKASEIDTMQAGDQVKQRRVSELDSEPPGSPRPYGAPPRYDPQKDSTQFPPINEMESPPIPPAELYSPPIPDSATVTPGSERTSDYFTAGNVRRRGATRESSANNTPGTPGIAAIAELPGDDGQFTVDGQHFEPVASPTLSPISPASSPAQGHGRGPSDSSLQTNIDEVLAANRSASPAHEQTDPNATNTEDPRVTSPAVSPIPPLENSRDHHDRSVSPGVSPEPQLERRPSHARGLSDSTVQSDDTGVSGPTPQEREAWEKVKDEPRRPLSE